MVVTGETQSNQASQFDLKGYLAAKQQQVETALDRAFPIVYPDKIYEAMRYSLFAGGKRLRPVLCLATCDLLGGSSEMALPTACALEMIHTMSLIHDDLPAMDNDDYRRGKLTNHKVYGEAVAILAGDGLLAYAFEHIVEETKNVPADRLIKVISRLGRAVGAAGLVGGQVVDLDCEGKKDVTLDTLNFIHTHKTAALLEASVVSGGILAGGSDSDIQHLTRYAQAIGLAFQIVDDLLDITSTQEELGKSIGKDMNVEKATYPRLLGMEESRRQAEQLVEQAKTEVSGFGEQALPLMAIADYITARKN
ncbi:geranylgeranyl diphosphate synthase CrtE [Leptolyngbya sp. AN03gr2]|uniref:geranylgeranyl diphosphate synthase CrtE n=1 Tax=unclassified Leptolyngbya TaxID=2650499 RepID=UPI003D3227F1